MLVLGISDLENDTAAALIDDHGPMAAIEEDKLSGSSMSGGIPRLAIDECLREGGARAADLSLAALASRPNAPAHGGIFWKLKQLQLLRGPLGPGTPVVNFEHHLCHAASAFYPSPFDRALVLTLDESGDMWSGLLAVGEGTHLRSLRPIRYPDSLGWFYSQITELLGFRPGRDEHKVQWLSKEGTPEFIPVFRRLFSWSPDGLPVINRRYIANGLAGRLAFSSELCRALQVTESTPPLESPLGATIARSAQDFLEEAVVRLAETYRRNTGAKYLCVAGGVFLNVLLVRALEKQTGFAKVFVQPVSGNAGSALGAAYLARKHLEGTKGQREPLSHVYLGPSFEDDQIKTVLDNCEALYRYLPGENELLDETVRLLRDHQMVAWYQGRMEFGHRALGNRSILASPFSPYVIENLNQYVKH